MWSSKRKFLQTLLNWFCKKLTAVCHKFCVCHIFKTLNPNLKERQICLLDKVFSLFNQKLFKEIISATVVKSPRTVISRETSQLVARVNEIWYGWRWNGRLTKHILTINEAVYSRVLETQWATHKMIFRSKWNSSAIMMDELKHQKTHQCSSKRNNIFLSRRLRFSWQSSSSRDSKMRFRKARKKNKIRNETGEQLQKRKTPPTRLALCFVHDKSDLVRREK